MISGTTLPLSISLLVKLLSPFPPFPGPLTSLHRVTENVDTEVSASGFTREMEDTLLEEVCPVMKPNDMLS